MEYPVETDYPGGFWQWCQDHDDMGWQEPLPEEDEDCFDE